MDYLLIRREGPRGTIFDKAYPFLTLFHAPIPQATKTKCPALGSVCSRETCTLGEQASLVPLSVPGFFYCACLSAELTTIVANACLIMGRAREWLLLNPRLAESSRRLILLYSIQYRVGPVATYLHVRNLSLLLFGELQIFYGFQHA